MIRFYNREEYRRMYKKFEAEEDLDSAILTVRILRTTVGALFAYYERDFWYYQPAMQLPGNEM